MGGVEGVRLLRRVAKRFIFTFKGRAWSDLFTGLTKDAGSTVRGSPEVGGLAGRGWGWEASGVTETAGIDFGTELDC